MIIDAHTHIFEAGQGGPFNLPASADDLVRDMDAAGVDLSIVLPLVGAARNQFVHRECRRHPDRLCGLYSPEFARPAETIARMSQFFDQWQPRGLKIHPRLDNVTVRDAIVLEVLAWADEHHVPVVFDVFPWGAVLDNEAGYPLAYHAVAQKRPGLKLILAHGGGYRLMEALLVAKANPKVFLDLSFTPVYFKGSSVASDCAMVCRRLPPGRVLYGSDFPYVPLAESLEAGRLLVADADTATRTAFLGLGAAAMFGIAAGQGA